MKNICRKMLQQKKKDATINWIKKEGGHEHEKIFKTT